MPLVWVRQHKDLLVPCTTQLLVLPGVHTQVYRQVKRRSGMVRTQLCQLIMPAPQRCCQAAQSQQGLWRALMRTGGWVGGWLGISCNRMRSTTTDC
jgi:hypothetical protein